MEQEIKDNTIKGIKAYKIVSYVKQARNDVFDFIMERDIDFLGCSEPYVREKIDALIWSLKELKKHCVVVDKEQEENNT